MRLTTTAEALKQARKAGGKSQMDMAAEMDITRRTENLNRLFRS